MDGIVGFFIGGPAHFERRVVPRGVSVWNVMEPPTASPLDAELTGPALATVHTKESTMKLIALIAQPRMQGQIFLFNQRVTSPIQGTVAPCLARSDLSMSRAKANMSQDPLKPYGHFPPGEYLLTIGEVKDTMGPHPTVLCQPITGPCLVALEDGGRWGLMIHGGRSQDGLVPTYGCLRVHDVDMGTLIIPAIQNGVDTLGCFYL